MQSSSGNVPLPMSVNVGQHQHQHHRQPPPSHRHHLRPPCPSMLSTAAVVGGPSRRCTQVKCVFVGDGAIGKTSLIVSYTTNGYPAEYVPTAFDTYSVVVTIDNKPCQLQLCDTAGQNDFDSIRPLCYKHTDVFIVCFSVVCPASFASIRQKWLPEIRKSLREKSGGGGGDHNTGAIPPFILVGTQCDLRHDVKVLIELDAAGQQPISSDYARAMAAKLGAMSYIECSALTQKNLKEVFDTAILAALDYRKQVKLVAAKKETAATAATVQSINGGRSSSSSSSTTTAGGASRSTGLASPIAEKLIAASKSIAKQPKSPLVPRYSGHPGSSSPPPLPLSPHPQRRHHFLPNIEKTKGVAKISDARLVSWRKSLTKLSAQEALESEAAVDRSTTGVGGGDDYGEFNYSTTSNASSSIASMVVSPLSTAQPIPSTSSVNTSSPNYRTTVRSRRPNYRAANGGTSSTAGATPLLGCDLDDDQGFHDEEEEPIEEVEEPESVSCDDEQACLNGGQKSNCHYFYHQGGGPPPNANGRSIIEHPVSSSQKIKSYGMVGTPNASGFVQPASNHQSTYFYYRAPPPPTVPSPLYNDPYGSYQQGPRLPPQPPQFPQSPQFTHLHQLPQPPPSQAPRPPPSKLQSFFSSFSRPSSSTSGAALTTTTPTSPANQQPKYSAAIFSGKQTNLNTTLRSSSFFFLASGNYKKNVGEEVPPVKAAVIAPKPSSHSTSSSTNTCTTSSSSSSSSSSTMSNTFFKATPLSNHQHNVTSGFGSALYRSEIFQIMSNSVTELRNRKSLLKKFTLGSSSSSSSRSSSRRSSVSERSKLKAKKLKEMYYYDEDEDDYEEIDEGGSKRGSKCLFRCCFPFRRRRS